MTRDINRRVQALENGTNIGRVTVFLPKNVEDEAKAVESAVRKAGYDPAKTTVASIWRDEMFDEPFDAPFILHEERLKALSKD